MTVPVVRQRAKAPKTRTGCRTCRQRHIKCDEAKPECLRCTRTGRQCGGYDAPKRPKYVKKLSFVQPRQIRPLGSFWPSGAALQHMTVSERNAFDFFRMETIHQLPGDSWLLSWERLSMTAALTEPAILHASIALGALHQSSEPLSHSNDIKGSLADHHMHKLAIDQCNKAMMLASTHITTLSTRSTDAEVQVVMLISLLMFCFEVWSGRDLQASLHLRMGMRILYDRIKLPIGSKFRTSPEQRLVELKINSRTDMDILLQTFVRLDMDLTIQGRTDPFLYSIIQEDIPAVFTSLQDAMIYLDTLAASIQDISHQLYERALSGLRDDGPGGIDDGCLSAIASAYARSIDLSSNPELAARVVQAKKDVSRWMSAFAFIPVTSERQSAHLLAQIQVFCLWHQVSFWREANEMMQDRFEEEYEYILGLAERYVGLHRNKSPPGSPPARDQSSYGSTRPAFSVGTVLVPCIFIIAVKCRKSTLRRRAVELVRSVNLRGVFDSHCIASFCEAIIDCEEDHARKMLEDESTINFESHQVPREARLIEVNIADWATWEFYKADKCRMVYAKMGEEGEIEVGMQEFDIMR